MKHASQGPSVPRGAVLLLLLLSILWGANMVAIKVSGRGIAPIFTAGLRSVVAGGLVGLWLLARREKVFPRPGLSRHAAAVGALFGAEFACIYLGLRFTLASRTSVLLYTHPFFVAAGAHLFLAGDRLTVRKAGGLLLAFLGVALLFLGRWGEVTRQTLPGDLLILLGAGLWAATTLYIKRYLAGAASATHVLFYQLAFSVPVLFAVSAALEGPFVYGLTTEVVGSVAYQCLVVAFASYLVWFELIDRYSVSVLAAFTFFTPVFGVALSAALLPGEGLSPALVAALALVCCGMVLVNRPGGKPNPERRPPPPDSGEPGA